MSKATMNLAPRCYLCDGGIREDEPMLELREQDSGSPFPLGYTHYVCLQKAAEEGNRRVQARLAGEPEALKYAKAGCPPQFVKIGNGSINPTGPVKTKRRSC